MMRLFRNKLVMYNNISTIFYILGSSGFITFMSRVMEVQFNRSSASGSIFTGPVTIMGMVIGLLTSGYVITKLKPPPKYLFFWNVVVGLVSMCGSMAYSSLGCEGGNLLMLNGSLQSFDSGCFCDGISYSPVCDLITKKTYFSPCHAGCKEFDKDLNIYKSCALIESPVNNIELSTIDSVIATDFFSATIFSTERPIVEQSSTDKIESEIKPTERRMTLYDVYDEMLKPGHSTHDHDDTVDANELYGEDDEEEESGELDDSQEPDDSQERLLIHGDDDEDEIETLPPTMHRRDVPNVADFVERIVKPGDCFVDCTVDYYIFSLISLCSSLISSTGRIGNVLINFR